MTETTIGNEVSLKQHLMRSHRTSKVCLEYIWLDGTITDKKVPAGVPRSKPKVCHLPALFQKSDHAVELSLGERKVYVPEWGFDGSSTLQAEGHDSDRVLRPVAVYLNPLQQDPEGTLHLLVLNEVFFRTGEPHPSNTRVHLRESEEQYKDLEFWFGIEQEYTLFKDGQPLGFPKQGFPEPQGKYYCGIGSDRAFGRPLSEKHLQACIDASIPIAGTNAEVMPGQWEFQVGTAGPLAVSDGLVLARWLMARIGEEYGIVVSLEPKPVEGDWNGAGAHTNFSTKEMRESSKCFPLIIEKLKQQHALHIAVYGPGIEKRLTGKHETCPYTEFRSGISDRGASIRIPWQVHRDGKGYLEDRRPCANIDPYLVLDRIMRTVAGK